jgi:Protein of unknown function (DUF3574)
MILERRLNGHCAAFLLLSLGCAGASRAEPICSAPTTAMARVELYFGAGGGVTPHAFAQFLAREVTPRFPDGLSLFQGYGQWRDKNGRVGAESSRLLVIYYRPDPTAADRIDAIRAAYKKRFRQQSVLRADSAACVSF